MSAPKFTRAATPEEWIKKLRALERAAQRLTINTMYVGLLSEDEFARIRAEIPRDRLSEALTRAVCSFSYIGWGINPLRRELAKMLERVKADSPTGITGEQETWLRGQLGQIRGA